jgi:voltage-gated potassium channel
MLLCLCYSYYSNCIHAIFSFYSMVDLFTVVPIFIVFGREAPRLGTIYTAEGWFYYLLFGMSTTRILRALRVRRKLLQIEDAVDRYFGEMILAVTVMILFFAAVMKYLEYSIHNYRFHTWMYYVMVTISTVGYGDISPATALGRVAAMCFIAVAIVTIPKMTNELIEKMALQSIYARSAYNPKGKSSEHVVICGDLSSTNLIAVINHWMSR